MITSRAALCEPESVSSSTETERQRSLTKLIFSLGVCSVAKTAVIPCCTTISTTENLLGAQELPHHTDVRGQRLCVFMDKVRVCSFTRGLWMFIKRLIKDFGVFRSHRMYVKFACFSDSLYMKGDTQ